MVSDARAHNSVCMDGLRFSKNYGCHPLDGLSADAQAVGVVPICSNSPGRRLADDDDDGDDSDSDDDDGDDDDDDDDDGGDDDDNELVLAKLRSCCVGRCAASLSPEGEASLGIEIDQRSNHDQGEAGYHSLRIISKLRGCSYIT